MYTLCYHSEQLCCMQYNKCLRSLRPKSLSCRWVWLFWCIGRIPMSTLSRCCIVLRWMHTNWCLYPMCQTLWSRAQWKMWSVHAKLPKFFKCLYALSWMYVYPNSGRWNWNMHYLYSWYPLHLWYIYINLHLRKRLPRNLRSKLLVCMWTSMWWWYSNLSDWRMRW